MALLWKEIRPASTLLILKNNMKLVGEVIKDSRIRKKLSREKLEKLTKIKKEFIENLEENRWEVLPEYPVVVGFVKSIASNLNLEQKNLIALLRRDYPPKVLKINPNPDITEKFTWSPKLSFVTGVSLVFVIIVGYLIFQYLSFIKPPELFIEVPEDGQVVSQEKLIVKGKTDPDAAVLVNNQPTIVGEDGIFETEIEIFEGTGEVIVIAKSRSGKETTLSRKIDVELESTRD